MNGNHLENNKNFPSNTNSGNSSKKSPQQKNAQNNLFEQVLLGLFILIGGLAYLFSFPKGTLFITAGVLMLVNCLRQVISPSLSLDWITFIISFLCLSKGISTLFGYEISFFPILFCFLGIFILSKAWQNRNK